MTREASPGGISARFSLLALSSWSTNPGFKMQACTYQLGQLGVKQLLGKGMVGKPNVEAEVREHIPRTKMLK